MRNLFLAVTAMALAITVAPAFGQVTVGVGVFEGGHDVSASVAAAKGVDLGFRHREVGDFQTLAASVPVSSRYTFNAGWNWNRLGRRRVRSQGPIAGFTGNCKVPAGFRVVYAARGYPSMDNDSRGAGWSVGATRDLGSLVGVHVDWEWDRFWANRGPASVKSAGVSAGVTFRLGG